MLIWHIQFRIMISFYLCQHVCLVITALTTNLAPSVLVLCVAGGYYSTFTKQYHTNRWKIYFIQLCLVSSQYFQVISSY